MREFIGHGCSTHLFETGMTLRSSYSESGGSTTLKLNRGRTIIVCIRITKVLRENGAVGPFLSLAGIAHTQPLRRGLATIHCLSRHPGISFECNTWFAVYKTTSRCRYLIDWFTSLTAGRTTLDYFFPKYPTWRRCCPRINDMVSARVLCGSCSR